MTRMGWRDLARLGLLALLPFAAYAPAYTRGLLLGPGDGAALHFPLKVAVFRAYAAGEVPSWNPGIFSGTPLLSSYRPGAFAPLTVACAALPEFTAFQTLVLVSLALSGVLLYAYLRVLGTGGAGAYCAGILFALGPGLLRRLSDTASLGAAPFLVLLLLALEKHLRRPTAFTLVGLAAAVALLALAGSPEAAAAGALGLLCRLLATAVSPEAGRGRWVAVASVLGATTTGLLLAAPQIVPALVAWTEAGPGSTGVADPAPVVPGVTGFLVRYLTHTPALAFAVAGLFLLPGRPRVRGGLIGALVALPLLAVGRLAGTADLALDLAMAVVAGLVVDEHQRCRLTADGQRLRTAILAAGLVSVVAIALVAAVTAALPPGLAAPIALLSLSFIVLFSTGGSRSAVAAAAFLVPLTLSLALEPQGRIVWASVPSEAQIYGGTPTRQSVDRAMATRSEDRVLALVREWPAVGSLDLGYAGLGAVAGRRSANGYDPMVPLSRRLAYDGMGAAGELPESFFSSDAGRLELLGLRFVQVLTRDLTMAADAQGLGEELDLRLDPARPRAFPLPITPATELRLATALSDAVLVPADTPVARVTLRLASGREIPLSLVAGRDTAEWAWERPDVRALMRHPRARALGPYRPRGESFVGQQYLGVLPLPGRFLVDGIRIEALPGAGRLQVLRLGLFDEARRRAVGVSSVSGYLSDTLRFREAAATPFVRLLELRGGIGRGRVVNSLRSLPDEDAVRKALRDPHLHGVDPRREALVADGDVRDLAVPAGARASRAVLVRASTARLEYRAEGPGILVANEGFDPGWTARVDDRDTRVFRVNAALLGLVLPEGPHRVVLRHRARGLPAGLVLGALGLLLLLAAGRVDPFLSHELRSRVRLPRSPSA